MLGVQRPEGPPTGVGCTDHLLICSTKGPALPGGLLGQGYGEEGAGYPACESCVGGHCRPQGEAQRDFPGWGKPAGSPGTRLQGQVGIWGLWGDMKQQERAPSPLPQDLGCQVSQELLPPSPRELGQGSPTTPPGYLRLLQEAGPKARQVPSPVPQPVSARSSPAPQPVSTGSLGLSVFSGPQGSAGQRNKSLQAEEGWTAVTMGEAIPSTACHRAVLGGACAQPGRDLGLV